MSRDVSFFDKLGRLIELERRAERERLQLDRATLPLSELESRGLVVLDVELSEASIGLGGRELITFTKPDKRTLRSRLGPGDLVSVSPRKAQIDSPPSGTVIRATRTILVVAFDRPLPEWAAEGRLRIDVLANDVTYERIRRSLGAVQAMSSGQARDRRERLLGNSPPRFDPLPPFTPTRALNAEQLDAVTLALKARDFALVHGPPGTGKSTVLAEIAVQRARLGQRILCTSASNAAVDHLLELCLDAGLKAIRVGHPARVLPHLQQHTLDIVVEDHPHRVTSRDLFEEAFELFGYARKQRSQGRSRQRFSNARGATTEAKQLLDEARALEARAVDAVLSSAQVVCATCSMLSGSLLQNREFDVTLLDEATQVTEPLALAAFLKSPTLILAGDPQQLAPTVLSMEAAKEGLSVSLFERLLRDFGDDVKRMLKEQHRMHEVIMQFPSKEMYGGALRAHPDVAQRQLSELLKAETPVDAPPFVFLDTAGKGFDEGKGEGSESLINDGEANLIVARAQELINSGLPANQLGIITPYRAQAMLIRERLSTQTDLEIDTVDAFQGREKDAILISLVRSNTEQQLGFLTDLRRLNVALTRAKRHVFVVGDSATLGSNPFFERLLAHAHTVGGYRSAWEWPDPLISA